MQIGIVQSEVKPARAQIRSENALVIELRKAEKHSDEPNSKHKKANRDNMQYQVFFRFAFSIRFQSFALTFKPERANDSVQRATRIE